MSAINPEWYADEVANDLNDETDLTQYTNAVERDIETKALIEHVRVDEIPVDDVTGFYTSRIVITYAVLLYKKHLFMGYWGSSDGDPEDIYKAKLDEIKEDLRKFEPLVTRESILGLEDEGGNAKGRGAVVRVIPMYNGAGASC